MYCSFGMTSVGLGWGLDFMKEFVPAGSILPSLPTSVNSYSRTFPPTQVLCRSVKAQAPTPLHDSEH